MIAELGSHQIIERGIEKTLDVIVSDGQGYTGQMMIRGGQKDPTQDIPVSCSHIRDIHLVNLDKLLSIPE